MQTIDSNILSKKQLQRSISKTMALSAVIFIALLIHLSKWGAHSFEVIYLKASQWMHLSGSSQYDRLAFICRKIKNYKCLESSLQSRYNKTKDASVLKELALLHFQLQNEQQALHTYKTYFNPSNNYPFDQQAAFNFAQLLNKLENPESALHFYSQILQNQEENIIPVNVLRNKAAILSKMNRREEALLLIEKYISKVQDEDVILKQELALIQQRISDNS